MAKLEIHEGILFVLKWDWGNYEKGSLQIHDPIKIVTDAEIGVEGGAPHLNDSTDERLLPPKPMRFESGEEVLLEVQA